MIAFMIRTFLSTCDLCCFRSREKIRQPFVASIGTIFRLVSGGPRSIHFVWFVFDLIQTASDSVRATCGHCTVNRRVRWPPWQRHDQVEQSENCTIAAKKVISLRHSVRVSTGQRWTRQRWTHQRSPRRLHQNTHLIQKVMKMFIKR